MLAVDVSNYTGTLEPDELERWKAAGYGLVIVQAVDPPPGYPRGVTRQQIEACLAAGLAVDIYVWDWVSLGRADIERKLELVRPYAGRLRECWVDAEDTAAFATDARIASLREALEVVDGSGIFARPAGIYTGGWYWHGCMGNTTAFADRELWDSDYDGIVDTEASWTPYGGWTERRIKQWAGTSTLEGVGGVDLNVLSLEEAAEVTDPMEEPMPESEPIVAPPNAWAGLIGALAHVSDVVVTDTLQAELDRKTTSGKPASIRRSVVKNVIKEAQRVREEFVGPRP